MPEISRFFGIVIQMYSKDHAPPHFHARYGSQRVSVEIRSLAVLKGRMDPRPFGMVLEWAALHRSELLAAWERAQRKEPPGHIAPLG